MASNHIAVEADGNSHRWESVRLFNVTAVHLCVCVGTFDQGRSGLALSNLSQLELKNMLDELNKKIEQKKLRWESQKKDLETKLELNRESLEQKNNEVWFESPSFKYSFFSEFKYSSLRLNNSKDILRK